jgi:hypothetical protein
MSEHITCMLLCCLGTHPVQTTKVKAMTDAFIGRIVTALQLVCCFIDGDHPVVNK